MKMVWILATLSILYSITGVAWETDNITCRTKKIEDSAEAVNRETNQRIDTALKISNALNYKAIARFKKLNGLNKIMATQNNEVEALAFSEEAQDPNNPFLLRNQFSGVNADAVVEEGAGCSKSLLENVLLSQIGSPWMGNLETWASEASIPKCNISVSNSVFQVFTFTESMVAKSAGINPVININGHKIGVDKLSHFMTEGYNYYSGTKNEKDTTKKFLWPSKLELKKKRADMVGKPQELNHTEI